MEDGTANNGDSLYDVAVEEDGSAPPTAEVSALKSQVESLSKELKSSKSTITVLESQIEDYEKGRAEAALRIEQLEGEVKSLGAVVARASELEGDVSRLQHDLGAVMIESDENAAEAVEAKKAVEGLEAEKAALKTAVAALEEKASALAAEKERVEAEVAGKEDRVRELEAVVKGLEEKGRKREQEREDEVKRLLGKMDTLLKDVDAKEVQVAQAKKLASQAVLEADTLRGKLQELTKLGGANGAVREIEIELEDGKGDHIDWKNNVAMVAVPTASAVIIGAAICYLHYARRR